ncbi:MAG: VOC family protein [Nostocoides sp.]
MGRPVHFEIQADNIERAKAFYAAAFGWTFQDYSAFTGSPYWGVVTGEESEPGINGGLLQRPVPAPGLGQGTNAWVVTMGVDDYDATEAKILAAGGQVALPKFALPGMAWQGYYLDTEGNTIGIHQPDESAA